MTKKQTAQPKAKAKTGAPKKDAAVEQHQEDVTVQPANHEQVQAAAEEAEAKAKAEAEKEAAYTASSIEVRAKRGRFRRAGRWFTEQPVFIQLDDLSVEELDAILSEPNLTALMHAE